jgi:hypothetical protein
MLGTGPPPAPPAGQKRGGLVDQGEEGEGDADVEGSLAGGQGSAADDNFTPRYTCRGPLP